MKIHTDCRHYRPNVPCLHHKRTGASCAGCEEYAPADVRILIVKLDAMGDVLRTTACLEPLKRQHPRSHVTWVTRADAVPLLSANPHVDRVLTVESNYLELLLAEEFDLALGPDADTLSASIMLLAHVGEKRGFVADRRGGVTPLNAAAESWWRMGVDDGLKRANRRTYGEWLYAICELPPPVVRPWFRPSAAALSTAEELFGRHAPNASMRVCFNTGAGARWQEKRWKWGHYAKLARHVRRRWPDSAISLVGGPGEKQFNAALLASDAGFIDAGTDNSIDGFAGIIACADWIVTPDSLGYHLACAVGTRAVCLVGPTSPWELDRYDTNHVLHAGLECIACYLARCPYDTTCMDALTADDVYPAIEQAAAYPPRWSVVERAAATGAAPAAMAVASRRGAGGDQGCREGAGS
jgi:heptosyltransferase-2